MAETLTIRTASSTEVVKIAVPGPQGPAGQGVPTGGTTGQVLRKASGSDYDTEWAAAGAGSGSVTSVAMASTDLTISGSPITTSGTITANIAANAVTLEKLQTISSEHLLGRHGSGNGGVQQVGLGTGLAMSGSNVRVATTGITAGTYTKLTIDETGRATAGATATPQDIGAQSIFVTSSINGASSPAATRAIIYDVSNFGSAYDINLPITNSLQGDIFVFRTVNLMAANVTIKYQNSPSPAVTVATLTAVDQQLRFIYRANAQQWDLVPVDTHTHAAADITSGTLTHERGGLEADVSAYNGLVKISGGSTSAVTVTSAGEALLDDADAAAQRTTLGLGTAATAATGDFAAASHTHTATAISDSTTAGRALLTAADAAAQRTSLGLATIATSGSASDLGSGTVPIARLGSSGTPSGSTYLAGDNSWKAVSGVTTGSVDNAILRADGTGGSTSQSSDINILDATTSTQNNVAITNEHSGQTNSALVLCNKGTGGFIVSPARPDGTSTGGNARGNYAVDVQTFRSANTQVANGLEAVAVGNSNTSSNTESVSVGKGNTSSGLRSVAVGASNTASNEFSVAVGRAVSCGGYRAVGVGSGVTSSGDSAVAIGRSPTASGASSIAIGAFTTASNGTDVSIAIGSSLTASGLYSIALGMRSVADRAIFAHANGRFAADGDVQRIRGVFRRVTTNNTATELFLDGSAQRLTIPSGKVIAGIINCMGVKSDGSAVAHYVREFCGKNVAGTSSLVGSVTTIGTDQEDNASTDISVTISDANDAVTISVTGIASETWRWVASVDAVEVAYGT